MIDTRESSGPGRGAAAVPQVHPKPLASSGIALSMLLAALGTSIANVALPTLARDFGASFAEVQWVVVAYLLASTAVIVGAGRLGDLFGPRRVLCLGLLWFTAASLGCALAPDLPTLIAARAAQGAGAAAMMALATSLGRVVGGRERTGAVLGLLGTMSAVGTALGPTLGGLLIEAIGWRWVFAAMLPLGLLSAALVAKSVPGEAGAAAARREPFDVVGMVLLSIGMAAVTLVLGAVRHGFGVWQWTWTGVAVAAGALLLRVERRVTAPLLHLELLRDRSLRGALSDNGIVSAVLMATLVVGPFHLTRAIGLEAGSAGLVMSVGPVVAALIGVPAGRLVDRVGAARVVRFGMLGVGVGAGALAALATCGGVGGYLTGLAVTTGSYSLFQAANNTAVMVDASAERRGVVSGLLSLSRSLGLMIGAAGLGAVFAVASGTADVASASASQLASATRATFAVGAALVLVAMSWRVRG